MSTKKLVFGGMVLLSGAAFGQTSSVTFYGLLDAGMTYTDKVIKNGASGSTTELQTGVAQGSRWGLRGSEDLGGGNQLVFGIESGFNLDTGTLGAGGRLFGYGSQLGVQGSWGALTVGRQYDFIGWYFPAYAVAANTPAGLLAWSLPSYSAGGYVLGNRVWGEWVDNSIKYQSPVFGGFDFGVLHGFGEQAGSLSKNATTNAIVNYNSGPFGASVSYYQQKNVSGNQALKIVVLGTAYSFSQLRLFGMASDVHLSEGAKPRARTYELGGVYTISPALQAGLGLQHQTRDTGIGSARQLTLSLDYFLSKRTDVYVVGAFAHDKGFGAQAVAAIGGPSTNDNQTALRIGIRHKF